MRIAGNLTKNQRYSSLSHLYIGQKVRNKKYIAKQRIAEAKKTGEEQGGNNKK
ncbi:TPA: hypothetical protein PJQ94_000687 [Escherichia coli]|nr:hypothetical protein [Escherichia coli]EFI8888965.1 hypothetical protein [Escherichia coli]EFO6179487.1 hypothetical protein [Escherichia coli]EFT6979250.1 hypothetical protein [Escherichia coli]EJB6692154.1 hypothetical protein [Escherichia coli]